MFWNPKIVISKGKTLFLDPVTLLSAFTLTPPPHGWLTRRSGLTNVNSSACALTNTTQPSIPSLVKEYQLYQFFKTEILKYMNIRWFFMKKMYFLLVALKDQKFWRPKDRSDWPRTFFRTTSSKYQAFYSHLNRGRRLPPKCWNSATASQIVNFRTPSIRPLIY